MTGETAPATWVRLQAYIDASGWPAVLAMAGEPALPLELAEDEAAQLKRAGAKVLRDLGGYPCVRTDDPQLEAWLAALGARVTAKAAEIERGMELSRQPVQSEIQAGRQLRESRVPLEIVHEVADG